MRRLLQLVLLMLGLATLLTPLVELFDRWDLPGTPMNDTELGVLGLVLVLALILLVSKLSAALDKLAPQGGVFYPQSFLSASMPVEPGFALLFNAVPQGSPPLRI